LAKYEATRTGCPKTLETEKKRKREIKNKNLKEKKSIDA
jgi:hypothetical protein